MTTIGVLGATGGIAHACERQWARRGASFRLVGRDEVALNRVAADLSGRHAGSVEVITIDLGSPAGVESAVESVFAAEAVDVVLIAFGIMPAQDEADRDSAIAFQSLHLNGSLTVLAAHLVTIKLLAQGSGSLVVLGSVAGDRGRQSNYLYGSAKAMVATGLAGLQHRTSGTTVHVTLVKPGPTETPMTHHLRGGKMHLAKAEDVARDIVRGVDNKRPVVYTPRRWQVIMAILRALPRRIFEKTSL